MNLPRPVVLAGACLAALLALAVVVLAGARLLQRGEVLRGISVAGVELGGLSDEEARAALAPTVAAREADPVLLTSGDTSFELDPATISYRVDLDRTVAAVMAIGRDEGFVPDTVRQFQAFWREHGADLVVSWDDEALDRFVGDIAEEMDTPPFPGAIAADPDSLEVTVEPPHEGVAVLHDDTREVILDALRTEGPDTVALPVEVEPTTVELSEVEAVAEQARRAIAEPLTLRSDVADAEIVLERSELAQLVILETSGTDDETTVSLAADGSRVAEIFGDRAERFEVEPVSARFDVAREPPTTLDDKDDVSWRPQPADVDIVPSTPGWRFSAELAAEQLTQLLREARREATLRLEEVEADLTTAQAEELGITQLLGTFTTYHACCQTRVHNIQRLADMVDGTLVKPGEQFSINQISGNRTCAKGFAEAGMILNGEIVDVCGGGVSQFGTTTVNAVFFSGLTADAYKPHSFYISRYPMGREATLNYPSPDIDVRFTNDTGHGIYIRTWHTSTSITVSFYGQSDVERVTAVHGSPRNVKPYPTVRRVNRSLPPESERRVQSGRNGFSVTVTRIVEREGGVESKDDWSWTYVPEREIIEYNPEKKPEPEPEPEPEPDPEESPPSEPSPSPDGDGGDGG